MSKPCTVCKQVLPLESFANQATGKLGKRASCKQCVKSTYKHSKKGVVLSIYGNQKAKSKQRNHPQPNYTKEDLYEWCMAQPLFHTLYEAWEASNYSTKLTPSGDRLDDYKPYTLDNLQLVTSQDNSKRYHSDAIEGKNTKSATPVVCYNLDGTYHSEYHSLSAAARAVNTSHANIRNVCNGVPIARTESDGTIRYSTPKKAKGFIWKYK